MNNVNTSFQDKKICPYCGFIFPLDADEKSGEEQCDECGCTFHLQLDYEVTYTTTLIKSGNKNKKKKG